MLLGDVLAQFDDEAIAGETLFTLDDILLVNQVTAAAAAQQLTAGEFAVQSVGRFMNGASDEEWLTLVGLLSCAENPGQVFLRRVLATALAKRLETLPGNPA